MIIDYKNTAKTKARAKAKSEMQKAKAKIQMQKVRFVYNLVLFVITKGYKVINTLTKISLF